MSSSFLWGVATSSHQIEGNNHHNDWWQWEKRGNIEGGVLSGEACNHRTRYKEDIQLVKDLGCNSYRFSIEWSRLQPQKDKWDQVEIEYYREVLKYCHNLGITPFVTLHHFTQPLWLFDEGGFANTSSQKYFSDYVTRVVDEYGELVSWWCTFNEPMVHAIGAYIGKYMPPATYSPLDFVNANVNMLICHRHAYQIIKDKYPNSKVGVAHNLLYIVPARKWHPLEWSLSKFFSRLYNWSWINAEMGRVPNFSLPFLFPKHSKMKATNSCDYIGVNYYTRAYVHWRPRFLEHEVSQFPLPASISFARRREVKTDLDWGIYPKGLGLILKKLAKFKMPIIITENGLADKSDKNRGQFIKDHLGEVAKACEQNIDVVGYYHWSLMDNFEWIKGFWPRFGLYYVNYETQERTLLPSGLHYKTIIEKHNGEAPKRELLN